MVATNIGRLSLRKNDQVQVISGRVEIEKVMMIKRHSKPTQKNPQGGILEKEASLHYSNVLLMCPKCNRGVRHGYKVVKKSASKKGAKGASDTAKEAKVRVCKRCGESLDLA